MGPKQRLTIATAGLLAPTQCELPSPPPTAHHQLTAPLPDDSTSVRPTFQHQVAAARTRRLTAGYRRHQGWCVDRHRQVRQQVLREQGRAAPFVSLSPAYSASANPELTSVPTSPHKMG